MDVTRGGGGGGSAGGTIGAGYRRRRAPQWPGKAAPRSLQRVRDVLDFYRRRPVLGTVVGLAGLAMAVLIVVLGSLERPVAAVALMLILGLLVGGAIAAAQRPGQRPDDR